MSTQTAVQRRAVALSIAAVTLVAVGLIAFRSPAPAVAESGPVVALWEMDEGAGATVMADSSGNGIDGAIGSDVDPGGGHYEFPEVSSPANEPYNPERIVEVVDNDNLEPEDRDLFVVEYRFRTTRSFGNVVQKGQNSGPRGYWKFEHAAAEITCLFQGPPITDTERGDPDNEFRYWPRKAVSTPDEIDDPETPEVEVDVEYDDGQWHTVRCELDRDNPFYSYGILRLYVDDMSSPIQINPLTEPLGDINNAAPLTIGGKANCDQIEVTCDYFDGDVDAVRIERTGTTSTTGATTTTTTSTTTTTTTTTVASGGPTGGGIDAPAEVTPEIQAERGVAAPLPLASITTTTVASRPPPAATTTTLGPNCHPSYPDFCIAPPPPDLDCRDFTQKRFRVLPPDPHRLDFDRDGIGCEN